LKGEQQMACNKQNIPLKRLVFAALVAAFSGGFYLIKADAQSIGEPGRGHR